MAKRSTALTYRCCFCGGSVSRGKTLVEVEWGRCPLALSEDARYPQQIANYAHIECLTTRANRVSGFALVPGRPPTALDEWPEGPPHCDFCGEPCPLNDSLLKLRLTAFRGGTATLWSHQVCFFKLRVKGPPHTTRE